MNNYHLLSPAAYTDLTYKTIKLVERENTLVYIDPKGLATIGTGFLLGQPVTQKVRDAVFKALEFHDTRSDPGASQTIKDIEDRYRKELQAIFDKKWTTGTDSQGWNPAFLAEVDEAASYAASLNPVMAANWH